MTGTVGIVTILRLVTMLALMLLPMLIVIPLTPGLRRRRHHDGTDIVATLAFGARGYVADREYLSSSWRAGGRDSPSPRDLQEEIRTTIEGRGVDSRLPRPCAPPTELGLTAAPAVLGCAST